MAEELPPLVTKLKGDLSDLAKTIAEAEAIVDKFNDTVSKKVETSAKETGEKAGKELADGLAKAVEDGSKTVGQTAKDIGDRAGTEMTEALGAAVVRNTSTSLARDLDHAAQGIGDAFGASLSGGGFLTALVNALSAAMAAAGKVSSGSFLDSFGQAFSDSSLSTVINKLGGLIPNFGHDAEQIGQGFREGILSGIKGLYTQMPEVMAPITAFVGAAIGGAILAAVGGGVIAAGIAAQLQDPVVHAAASDLGQFVSTQFQDASESLVDPLLAGIGDLKANLAPVFADLKRDFSVLAPYVENFAMYLGIAAQRFMPGFSQALQAAGPVLGVIARDLPILADGFSTMFEQISKGSKGEAEALDALIRGVAALAAGIGYTIRFLSDAFDLFIKGWVKATDIMQHVPGLNWAKPLHDQLVKIQNDWDTNAQSSTDAGQGFSFAGDSAQGAAGKLDVLAAAVTNYDTRQRDATMDLLSFKDQLAQIGQQFVKGKDALNINTEAGRRNIEMVDQAKQKIRDHADQVLKDQGSAVLAAKAAQDFTAQLDAELRKAGATKDQIEKLNKMLDEAATYRKGTVDISVYVHGSTAFLENQGTTLVVGTGRSMKRWGGVDSYAQGGIAPGVYSGGGGSLVKFAEPETGGEAYIPRNGDPGRNLRTLATAASWMGATVVPAMASGGGRGGYASMPELLQPIVFNIDGQRWFETVIRIAQQRKQRTGSTGLV